MNKEDFEELARRDFKRVAGKVVLTDHIIGFVGKTDDQVNLDLAPPLRVRVTGMELHWSDDEWLDPYWDVEIVDAAHPELRSCYVYGTSYNSKTGLVTDGPKPSLF